jgi:hypothetical protein
VPKQEAKLPPPTREELKKAKNNMRQILLAVHSYHDVHNGWPANVTDGDGKAILSWRVQLLPYLEQGALHKKFDLTEPWDGPANKKLIDQIPDVFAPVRVTTKVKGETFYQGFAGAGSVFEPRARLSILGITDGTSNTIAVVEAGEPVIWTKPDDLPFDPDKDLPKLGGQLDGDFYAGMCDGSASFVYKADWDPTEFKKAITTAGGEIFTLEKAFGSGTPKKK